MNITDTIASGMTGIEQLRALMRANTPPPMIGLMDMVLVEVDEGRVAFGSTPSTKFYNPLGGAHGGYAATMLDSACGSAVQTLLGAGQRYTTLELKVAYHKGITTGSGRLRAEGRIVTMGRRAAFAEATVKDQDGRLYASATSTLMILS